MNKLGIIDASVTPELPGNRSKLAGDRPLSPQELDGGLLFDLSTAVESRASRPSSDSPSSSNVRKADSV